jgi:hypothetical protein
LCSPRNGAEIRREKRNAAMPYVEGRIIHDADSHLMELPDCLDDFFDPKLRGRYHALPIYKHKLGAPGLCL